MSVKADNTESSIEQQLADLEHNLRRHENDEAMLGEIGLAMRQLLSGNGGSEVSIRQLLERQFEQGHLRPETYELVERLLGKIVTEEQSAKRVTPPDEQGEAPYVDTAVLEQPEDPGKAAPPENILQVGSVLRDRFLLKSRVSEGSMGTVYKALDRRLAEAGEGSPFVAIKVLNAKLSRSGAALRALQQEAAKGRCLSHPNIVRFIDLDREGDDYFIIMEWLEGKSLARILDDTRGRNLDLATSLDIVRQVGRALSYAHQRGVVHADVKPGNIIVTPEGQAKLIDFGVARVRQKENEGKSRFDPDVMRAGSPAYSSMQVLTGEDPVPADDVFSLACLLYRLVAGYRVFGPRNAADAAQEGMEPQKPNELSDSQWQALKKALSYSRVTRFESPKAFLDAFGAGPSAKVGKASQPVKAAPPAKPAAPAARPKKISAPLGHDETTEVALDLPMRAERDPIMYDVEDEPRRSPWRLAVIGTILVASVFVVVQTGVIEDFDSQLESIDGFIDQFTQSAPAVDTSPPPSDGIQALEALPETDVAETGNADSADNVVEELIIDAESGSVNEVQVAGEQTAEAAVADAARNDEAPVPAELADDEALVSTEPDDDEALVPADILAEEAPLVEAPATGQADPTATATAEVATLPPPIDFSQLEEPALLISLRGADSTNTPLGELAVREGGGDAIVDLVRTGDLSQSFSVQFTEPNFAGSPSALDAGRYRIENEGLVVFEPGQPRARTRISVPSNNVREDDRQVTLSVRNALNRRQELAIITLSLEDDDQRNYEASLPPNTIGFLVQEITVREFDPAVQIDIVRYQPDNSAQEINFLLTDITATEGQDYFAPGMSVIYFGPGQRTARILIPLGQDSRSEPVERFTIELDTPVAPPDSNIFSRITVMIRDDDS